MPKTVNNTLSVLNNIFKYTKLEKNFPVAKISNVSVPKRNTLNSTAMGAISKMYRYFLVTGLVHSYVKHHSTENYFKPLAKECKIHNVNFHTFRHTFSTRCVELEFDIKNLSKILEQASINVTLNQYVCPSMELKQKNMDLLSDLLTTKQAVIINY